MGDDATSYDGQKQRRRIPSFTNNSRFPQLETTLLYTEEMRETSLLIPIANSNLLEQLIDWTSNSSLLIRSRQIL